MGANDGVKYKKKLLNKVKTEQDRIKQEKQRMSTKSEEEEHKHTVLMQDSMIFKVFQYPFFSNSLHHDEYEKSKGQF